MGDSGKGKSVCQTPALSLTRDPWAKFKFIRKSPLLSTLLTPLSLSVLLASQSQTDYFGEDNLLALPVDPLLDVNIPGWDSALSQILPQVSRRQKSVTSHS